ncbi:hypothetical protein KUTeg_009921 [Tegillarca granosa]|uniref:Uncharacterized protein n=1 Tax=Tegillarca granosa TaxID=220873 RepID=A0ABQ9F589_TEGGR|nr:hypothetical protein KUTeg_009921 [Tegillarca granosa]
MSVHELTENPKKWDLSRSFLFQMSENGLVTFVHYHPEDHDEVVTLKKVLASVLSANVKKFHEENVHSFTAKEIDHTDFVNSETQNT